MDTTLPTSMSARSTVLLIVLVGATSLAPAHAGDGSPEATDWSPRGDNVDLYGPILVTWTARMDAASVEAAFRLTDNTTVWGPQAFQWIHATAPPWTSRASPLIPLPPSTDFLATVFPTARDASGQYALDQDGDGTGGEPADALVWTFRTENGMAPRVQATSPPDGAMDVAVSASIAIAFGEPMDRASVESGFGMEPPTAGTFRWNGNESAVTLVPDLFLFSGTTYNVTLAADVARDANGAPLDGDADGVGGDDFTFAFTTLPDFEPPRVLNVVPTASDSNVSVAARITVRFSEAMNRTSVEDAWSYTNGTATWNGTAGAFAWSGASFPDDTVTFNPDENLPFATWITVAVNGTGATDRAGDPLDGDANGFGGDDFVWSFETEAEDLDRPRVLGTDPPDGAVAVPETTAVHLAFSERMNRTSVEDAFVLRDPVRTWTKSDGWFAWDRGDEGVAYAPSSNLAYDSDYTLSVGRTAMDVNGNRIDGDGSGGNFTATFRTRAQPDITPPRVVDTIPAPDARGVSRTSRITITFDDAMDRDRTEAAIGLAVVTPVDPVPVLVGDFLWAAGDHAVSFRRLGGPFDWDTEYTVAVDRSAEDDGGNALEASYAFTFATEAWSGRVIGRVLAAGEPLAGATVSIGDNRALSLANGTFEFPGVPAGTYELTISKPGYQAIRRTVTLDHRSASADFTTIDLGEFSLAAEEAPVLAVVAGLVAAIAAVLALGWFLRRRRGPPEEHFEDWDEETAEGLR